MRIEKILRFFAAVVALAPAIACAQFTTGELLTAAGLNAALAAPTITNGTITGLTAPLGASLGGLGVASPTANAVLVGNGSGAVQAVGPCTNGQMLLGVTGGAPYCGTNPGINGASIVNTPISGSTGSFTTLTVNSASMSPNLTGTSSSLGGSSLAAGACSTGTVSISGATTSMGVVVTPATYPGAAIFWKGYVSATGTVTVAVCAAIAATPTASTYNVRVVQ